MHDYHRYSPIPHFQQTDHHDGVQQDADDLNDFLKNKIFVSRNNGSENTQRKSDGQIKNQNDHQHLSPFDLNDGHRISEQCFDIEIQSQAGSECKYTDHRIEDQKHSEHGVLLLLSAFRAKFSRITDNSISKAEIHDRQIGDHRRHERIKTVFALPHHPQHIGRIKQPDQRVQPDHYVI